MIESILAFLKTLLINITLAGATGIGKLLILITAILTMFGLFNLLNRGINDRQLVFGYTDYSDPSNPVKVPPNKQYLLYRGLLLVAQLIPMATVLYIPWGWHTGDWSYTLAWELGGNAGFIAILLLYRFLPLEKVILRTENNIATIIDTSNPKKAKTVLTVEGVAMIGAGLVLAGIAGGESKELLPGIISSLISAPLCLIIMTAWIAKKLREKVHTFDGVANQSLSDGIKAGNPLAATRASVHVAFISVLLFGAMLGEYIDPWTSIWKSTITLGVALWLSLVLDKLLERKLLHLRGQVESEKQMIAITIIGGAVLIGIVLAAVALVSGSLDSL